MGFGVGGGASAILVAMRRMWFPALSVLLASMPGSTRASSPPDQAVHRRALERVDVFIEPNRIHRQGWVAQGSVFEIGRTVKGRGCDADWAVIPGGGFVCLEDTEPAPRAEPHLPRAAPDVAVPFVYAARQGNPAYSYAFVERRVDDEGQPWLVRPGGRKLEAEAYDVFPRPHFRGRDLRKTPVPDGVLPAWTIIENAPIYAGPSDDLPPAATLPKHTAVLVSAESVDDEGPWVRIPGALGLLPGYMNDREAVRHWSPAPPVEGVEPQEVWVDLDLNQQVIALRRGRDEILYVTLVSSGVRGRSTPTGLYRIRDKRAWSSMGSRPDAEEPYFVENVPWTMYFRDYYAVHGAYWHDVFGQRRSHGCVNLSPHDAKVFYDALSPTTETTVMRTYATEDNPGSLVRIRKGLRPVRDRTKE